MKKLITLFVALILSAGVFAQDLEEVLQNHFDAVGMDKLVEYKSMKVTGTSSRQGMESAFDITFKRPGKMHLLVPIQGMELVQAYDGETAWMINPFGGNPTPQVMTGVQAKSMKNQADLDGALWNYADKGYTAEYEGTEEFEGTEVHIVTTTDEDGDITKYYIDGDTWVILKQDNITNFMGNTIETTTIMSNYQETGGVLVSMFLETQMNGQTVSQITMKTIEYDVEVNDDLFKMPKEEPAEETESDKQ